MATAQTALPRAGYKSQSTLMEWLTTVDHKKIGIMYMVAAFVFFLLGGIMALFIRLELAQPGQQIVSADAYNQLFSMHGTTMIFLFIIPMFAGMGNYFVPLHIGARDMAFPRINALSFWLAVGGAIVMYSSCWSARRKLAGRATARWQTVYSPNRRARTCGSWACY